MADYAFSNGHHTLENWRIDWVRASNHLFSRP